MRRAGKVSAVGGLPVAPVDGSGTAGAGRRRLGGCLAEPRSIQGAGGSVFIRAGTVSGTGVIDVSGANSMSDGGAGGGGRIGIAYRSTAPGNVTLVAKGGAGTIVNPNVGGAGTVVLIREALGVGDAVVRRDAHLMVIGGDTLDPKQVRKRAAALRMRATLDGRSSEMRRH